MELKWTEGFEIRVSAEKGEVLVSANREGLLSLASHLTRLAEEPGGSHLHLDAMSGLEEGSAGLILEKAFARAYFAGGCFWCAVPIYKAWGAKRVVCGYSGGDEPHPRYEDVKAQKTGHRETVEILYDPDVIRYGELLDIYLANIDPYDGGGQYIDRGHSYSPAVYWRTVDERTAAEEKLAALEAESGRKPAVALEPFKSFHEAEPEHQDYYLKHPEAFEEELRKSGRKP